MVGCSQPADLDHLLIGMILYFQSPAVRYVLPPDHRHLVGEHVFFRYIHITLMLAAVIVITIGSAKAKRVQDHTAKYRTMLWWFVVGTGAGVLAGVCAGRAAGIIDLSPAARPVYQFHFATACKYNYEFLT